MNINSYYITPRFPSSNNKINTRNNKLLRNYCKKDKVSFSARKKDITELNEDEIISLCKKAINNNQKIGEGHEAKVYTIPGYEHSYCLRISLNPQKTDTPIKPTCKITPLEKANHAVMKLNDGIKILEYIPGIPLKIIPKQDTPSGIKVKEAMMDLVANNFPEATFMQTIDEIEKNRRKNIIFDSEGENLLIDPMTQKITPIDYNTIDVIEDYDYNPISRIYTALGVENTKYSMKIFGLLCNAYAERLKKVDIKDLNLDILSKAFNHRGWEKEPFNNFEDKELLHTIQDKLFNNLLEIKLNGSKKDLEEEIKNFKNFIYKNVMFPDMYEC